MINNAEFLKGFQHTAARRRLGFVFNEPRFKVGFNTQPPEGGWATVGRAKTLFQTFQHTAARRRLGRRNARGR